MRSRGFGAKLTAIRYSCVARLNFRQLQLTGYLNGVGAPAESGSGAEGWPLGVPAAEAGTEVGTEVGVEAGTAVVLRTVVLEY